ncbi:uncharacterized protein LOC129596259 [Paramacrobiotus metropolitanus]|uniref:uncharacterized protein LOC129596259 n=1 Tax=Paramacrobiotus metropolitanus TaxID=2943436 RepID=UPI002445634A|nr:uncharacterized protein LOC129596259 [Paramacrobiotus metropolitanus]
MSWKLTRNPNSKQAEPLGGERAVWTMIVMYAVLGIYTILKLKFMRRSDNNDRPRDEPADIHYLDQFFTMTVSKFLMFSLAWTFGKVGQRAYEYMTWKYLYSKDSQEAPLAGVEAAWVTGIVLVPSTVFLMICQTSDLLKRHQNGKAGDVGRAQEHNHV